VGRVGPAVLFFLLLGGRFCPHTVLAMGGQTRYNVFTLPFAGGARAAN